MRGEGKYLFGMRAATPYFLLVMMPLISMPERLLACHEKHHDCHAEIGPSNIRELPFRIARDHGFFEAEHVHPEIIGGAGPRTGLAALAKGDSLIAVASATDAAELQKTADVRIVAVLQQESDLFLAMRSDTLWNKSPEMQKMPQKEAQSSAKTDLIFLRGTTVGTAAGNSETPYVGRALASAGVDASSYHTKEFSSHSELVNSVSHGQLGAAVVDVASAFEAQRHGLILVPLSHYLGSGMQTIIIGKPDTLGAQRDGVARILQALRKAVSWIYDENNRSEVINTIQKEYRFEPDVAAFVYDVEIKQLKTFSKDLVPNAELLTSTNTWLSGSGFTLRTGSLDRSYAQ